MHAIFFKYQLVFFGWRVKECEWLFFYVHGLLSVQECICAYMCEHVWGIVQIMRPVILSGFSVPHLSLCHPHTRWSYPWPPFTYTVLSEFLSINNSLATTTFKVSTGCTAIFVTVSQKCLNACCHLKVIFQKYFFILLY